MARLAAVDAQAFWMSAKIPSDQFVLYAFSGDPGDLDTVLAGLRERARACADLRVRIADESLLRYPRWVSAGVDPAQFVTHRPGLDWSGCLDAVAALTGDQLDPTVAAWRLHLYGEVSGAPRSPAPVTVAVLQIAHALADGLRVAQLAGWLFGRDEPVVPINAPRSGHLLPAGLAAARAQRQLDADIAAGSVPAPAPSRPVLFTNTRPAGAVRIRTFVRRRDELPPGPTVTVVALAAIGRVLAALLRERGTDADLLGAEVPMAHSGIRDAHNHFRNVGVGLYADVSRGEQLERIGRDLRDAQARGAHPAVAAQRRALAATPAPLVRWGVRMFDPDIRAAMVTGNTVVSSVNRGAADLRLGAATVSLTASYPALSPMMGLTHGVHGIGDTVAISVHAADSALCGYGAVDDYVARLEAALS